MKKQSLLAVLAVLSLGLAACGNASGGTSSNTPNSSDGTSSSGSGMHDIDADPTATVLEGLDTSKDTIHDAGSSYEMGVRTYLGAYAEKHNQNYYAYGWIEYSVATNPEKPDQKSTYGVAARLEIDADGKILSLKMGAPKEGDHNLTPYYAMAFDGGYAAYNEYIAGYQASLIKAFVGKSAYQVFKGLSDAVVNANEAPKNENDYGTFTPSSMDTYVISGATQSRARTDRAIYAACGAYLSEHNPNMRVFSHLAINAGNAAKAAIGGEGYQNKGSSSVKTGALKTTDGAYGYVAYMAWYSYYGAAVKIEVNPNKTIKHVSVGLPFDGAHNFSPYYILIAPNEFMNSYNNLEDDLNAKLDGRMVNEALAEEYKAGKIDFTQKKDQFTGTVPFIGAGATQTDTRVTMAVYNAIQGILDTSTPDAAFDAENPEHALSGLNMNNTDTTKGYDDSDDYNRTSTDYSKNPAVTTINQDRNGYYVMAEKASYGWIQYPNPWDSTGNSYYGAAVKLTWDEDGKVSDVKVGLPNDKHKYTDFTTLYAATGAKYSAALDNYNQYLEHDMNVALKGKTSWEIYDATKTASATYTQSESNFVPGDYDFLGAGATQTTTRINAALFEAAAAAYWNIGNKDPFYKDNNKFSDLKVTLAEADYNKQVGKGIKKDGAVYGYALYYIAAWYSYYGAAIKLDVDDTGKITGVTCGQPTIDNGYGGSANIVNFTKAYTFNNPTAYADYINNTKELLEDALLNKTITEDLANEYKGASVTINPADLEANAYTPTKRFIGTGATQTDTRLDIAIYNALEAYLAK